jgi:hypothetical protein
MIPFEAVRGAMYAADPFEAFDRLVRAEQGRGRKVGQIFDDLQHWLADARALDGLSEDAPEAIFGTLDALTGGCHPDWWYRDPEPTATPEANGHPAAADPAAPTRNPE